MKPKFKVVTHLDYSCTVTSKVYRRKYEKGKIVKAAPDSVGLLVFPTRHEAQRFVSDNGGWQSLKIKRVQPIGKGTRIHKLCFDSHLTKKLRSYFKLINQIKKYETKKIYDLSPKEREKCYKLRDRYEALSGKAPYDSFAYPAVKVLD